MTEAPVVLVHGAWHGSWAWEMVSEVLEEFDIPVVLVDLPGIGRGGGDDTLRGHADYLRQTVAELGPGCLVVGHSYGGAVIAEAALEDLDVFRCVYLTAFMLDIRESCMGINDAEGGSQSGADAFEWDGDHIRMPAAAAQDAFYADLAPELGAQAIAKLVPEHRDTVFAATTHASWKTVPSSYIIGTRDRAILPVLQATMSQRAETVYSIEAGHSAMLTHPQLVAAIIAAERARLR